MFQAYLAPSPPHMPIASLPEHMQAALAEQMGQMRLIDRTTLDEVVAEGPSLSTDFPA